MSRPVRIEFPGASYHVTSRCSDDKQVFVDDEDRAAFLQVLSMVVARFNWVLHTYTMHDQHYQLVLEVPSANLSRGMRQLNGVYTQHYNRRHGDQGSLFQGRFKSVLFEPETFLVAICRHVVSQPLREDPPQRLTSYKWSSHRAMCGTVKAPEFLYTETLLSRFGRRKAVAQRKYKDHVMAGASDASPLSARSSQVLLGSSDFVAEMEQRLSGEKTAKRGPRRAGRRRSLNRLFRGVDNKTRAERNEMILRAHLDHAYTLMEIGDHLGIHYTTVSKVVNR